MEIAKTSVAAKGWSGEECVSGARRTCQAVKRPSVMPQWWARVIIHLSRPTHRINIKGEPACKLWTLGYTDVSTQVYHFGQMYLPVLTEGEVGVWWKGHMGPLHFLLNATISLQRL